MFKNYLLTAIRSLLKYKSYSSLNVIGLAISLAVAFLISFWVIDELSIGKIHKDADRIYRVERSGTFQGKNYHVPITSLPFAETLKADYPQVEDALKIDFWVNNVRAADKKDYTSTGILLADSNFFEFFTFPLIYGDKHRVLDEQATVVLTETKAEELFGDAAIAVGKKVVIDQVGKEYYCLVTGVMEDLPSNARMDFELVVEINTLLPAIMRQDIRWVSNSYFTYVKLAEGANIEDLSAQMPDFVDNYLSEPFRMLLGKDENASEFMNVVYQNINDIYLKGGLDWEDFPIGDQQQLLLFALIALMIIVIAAFNYTNMSVALASRRAREIGIRKSAGATKQQIIGQFLGEAFLITIISFLISIFFVEILLPWFNEISGKEFTLSMLANGRFILIALVILLVTSLGAGFYPAWYLSSFEPVRVLKPGVYKGKGKGTLQNILIVFQFTISAILIIVSLHMILQFRYIDKKDLGFMSRDVLVINAEANQVRNGMAGFRNALLQKPFVKEVSFCSQAPSSGYYSDLVFENRISEEPLRSFVINADSNFFEVFDIQLLAGRNFSRSVFLDSNRAEYIINETALNNLGLSRPEQAIGLDYRYPFDSTSTYSKIVGVMKDFHFRDLQHEIEALTIAPNPEDFYMISVRFTNVNAQDAIAATQNVWQKELPGAVFNHYLLEDRISLLYRSEQRLLNTLIIFSVFAILVATLGLLGLSAFITRQRKKEIGIRKVLGANVNSILKVFILKFIWLVVIANIIAAPLAYLFIDHWFANFAYHINIQWWVFLVSILLTAIIAMVSTISQVLKTAWLNPVESIKYE